MLPKIQFALAIRLVERFFGAPADVQVGYAMLPDLVFLFFAEEFRGDALYFFHHILNVHSNRVFSEECSSVAGRMADGKMEGDAGQEGLPVGIFFERQALRKAAQEMHCLPGCEEFEAFGALYDCEFRRFGGRKSQSCPKEGFLFFNFPDAQSGGRHRFFIED